MIIFRKFAYAVLFLFGCISELKSQDLLYFKDGSVKSGKIFSLLDEEISWGQMNVNNLPGSSVQTTGFSMLDSVYHEQGKMLHLDMLDPAFRKEKNAEKRKRREMQESEYDQFRHNFNRPGPGQGYLEMFDAVIFFRNKDSLIASVCNITSSHVYWYLKNNAEPEFRADFSGRWKIDSIHFLCGEKRYFFNETTPPPIDSIRKQDGTLHYLYEEELLSAMGRKTGHEDLLDSYESGRQDAREVMSHQKDLLMEAASFVGGMVLVGLPLPMIATSKITESEGFSFAPEKVRYFQDPAYAEGFRKEAGSIRGKRAVASYFLGIASLVLMLLIF
jgi:hypothetical protein